VDDDICVKWAHPTDVGTWGRMSRKTPMTQNTRCKAIYCSDGWLELREETNPEAWIATDTPHDIVV
jgi:hypothetical protein